VAFLGGILGAEVVGGFMGMLREEERSLIGVNGQVFSEGLDNSFGNYLTLLFLKVATLTKIRDKNIEQLFRSEDINGQ
jgi:hypothetical protein